MIAQARKYLGAYERSEMMIQAGLYVTGSDPLIDAAIRVWPRLDQYIGESEANDTASSFADLFDLLAEAHPE